MRQSETSAGAVNNSSGRTQGPSLPYPYDHLTKAEIVSLFTGAEPVKPLTQREFTRCALAVVARWCRRVHDGQFTCTESVKAILDSLYRIYKNR